MIVQLKEKKRKEKSVFASMECLYIYISTEFYHIYADIYFSLHHHLLLLLLLLLLILLSLLFFLMLIVAIKYCFIRIQVFPEEQPK